MHNCLDAYARTKWTDLAFVWEIMSVIFSTQQNQMYAGYDLTPVQSLYGMHYIDAHW